MFHLSAISNPWAIAALFIFVIAYLLVVSEEFIQLKKSKPVLLAAGIIWAIAAFLGEQYHAGDAIKLALEHTILEFSELFMFLVVAMIYVNTMEERQIFKALSSWLIQKKLSYRKLFWATGFLAFFLSPVLDNLTTALIMGAVVISVGISSPIFIGISCINIVVAANAGGAFTPFGDVTTLMVWQHGTVNFLQFLHIFFPALLSYLIPATFMYFAIPKTTPNAESIPVAMRPGAKRIMFLFVLTIITAIAFHQFLDLPPMLGMTTGLGYLSFLAYFMKRKALKRVSEEQIDNPSFQSFDFFKKMEKIEWDTLLFFYGVMLSIAGLATLGYLTVVADQLYTSGNLTLANTIIGVLSALLGNIPVLYALLTMDPSMSIGQWLLVTLTTGIGGNLLSIGSAAGIALMGQSQGKYTFFKHLKWSWAIALGYVFAILLHCWMNQSLF